MDKAAYRVICKDCLCDEASAQAWTEVEPELERLLKQFKQLTLDSN